MGNERVTDSTVERLIDELAAARDSVEELTIVLDHLDRNRDEFREMFVEILERKAEESHEATCCVHCDVFYSSLAEAVRNGWTSLQHDPSEGWDYLGICADCQTEERRREREAAKEREEENSRGGEQSVNSELLEALRFVVQEIQQPEMADSYVADALKKARAVLEKYMVVEEQDVESMGREMRLSEEQIARAKAEGVTTALGLRRIEKNARSDEVPETIACARCDVDSPESLSAALQEGWTDLCRDDGAGWNYLGICPECQARENAVPQPEDTEADEQGRLFG